MVPFRTKGNQQKTWKVDHLEIEEPDALQYLHEDEWDNSTLASTPSMQFKLDSGKNSTSILRHGGEPSAIIISVTNGDNDVDGPRKRKKLLEKLKRAIAMLVYFWRKKKSSRQKARTDSEMDLEFGPTAVIV